MLCHVQQDYAQCFTTSRSHAWNPGTRELTSEFASKSFNHFTHSLQPSLQAGKHFTVHLIDRQKTPAYSTSDTILAYFTWSKRRVSIAHFCVESQAKERPVETETWCGARSGSDAVEVCSHSNTSLSPSLKHTHKHARCHPACLLMLASQAD